MGVFWNGMNNRILKELSTCSCKLLIVQRSSAKPVQRYRKIDCKKPKERFQADTTKLPDKFSNDIHYLLNVKDHFSRFAWSYPLKSLKAKEVANCLEKLFKFDEIPKLFQTDNGTDFKGEVSALLHKYQIKHITSKPRTPKTQGMV